MTSIDGLPLIPIESLCKEMGYQFYLFDNAMQIETYQKNYLDSIPESVSGTYDFTYPGHNEMWVSENTTLLTADGFMRAETFAEGEKDPTLWKRLETPLDAAGHTKIEVRVRYQYESEENLPMQMFFITDKDRAWSESKSVKVTLKKNDSGGEWETYVFDMSGCEKWADNITNLRFDPFNASGYMEIDYIHVEK